MYNLNNQILLIQKYNCDMIGIIEPVNKLNQDYSDFLDYCAWLPKDEFKLMSLYYFNGYDIKEIANYLDYTETWISQKIKKIILKLRNKFGIDNLDYKHNNKKKYGGK